MKCLRPKAVAIILASNFGCSTTEVKKLDLPMAEIKTKKISNEMPWDQVFNTQSQPKNPKTTEIKSDVSDEKQDAAAILTKSREHALQGEYAKAEVTLRNGGRAFPDNLYIVVELAAIFLQTNRLDECFSFLGYFRNAFQKLENIDQALIFRYKYVLALAFLQKGETKTAHGILSDLIALDQSFVPGYAALASSYLRLGKNETAEFIVRRGMERSKPDASLFNILGLAKIRLGSVAEGISWFDRALEVNPQFPQALVNKGIVLLGEHQKDLAQQLFTKALARNPAMEEAYIGIGVIRLQEGSLDLARSSFEKVLELNPQNGLARYHLARVFLRQSGRQDDALRLFHEVLQARQSVGHEVLESAQIYISELNQRESI